MTEYIEREAICYQLEKQESIDGQPRAIRRARRIVADFPAADVVPVVRGRWEWDEHGVDRNIGSWVCGVCHARPETMWQWERTNNLYRFSGSHYCPNCGADMREPPKEEP